MQKPSAIAEKERSLCSSFMLRFYFFLIVLLLKHRCQSFSLTVGTARATQDRCVKSSSALKVPTVLLHAHSNQQQVVSPHWINGRRCLLVPSKNTDNRNEVSIENINLYRYDHDANSQNPNPSKLPPIVILGGMAQSISSWEHHLPMLSKDRDIFVYEYLGSGLGYRHPEFQLYYDENQHNVENLSEVCYIIYVYSRTNVV